MVSGIVILFFCVTRFYFSEINNNVMTYQYLIDKIFEYTHNMLCS